MAKKKGISDFEKMFSMEHLEYRDDITELHRAAVKGQTKEIQKALTKNPIELGVRTRDGNDLMMLAAVNGHVETTAYLLEFKADVHHRNILRKSVLDYVAKEGVSKEIPSMILRRMDYMTTELMDSPYRLTVEKSQQNLLKAGKKIVSNSFLGRTPDFNDAFGDEGDYRNHWMSEFKRALRLVRCGVLLLDSTVEYLEYDAALGGCLEVPSRKRFVYLADKNEIIPYNSAISTVYGEALEERMLVSATQGDAMAMSGLLKAGVHPNVEDHRGQTVLMRAAFHGRTETLQVLLDAMANVNTLNVDGYSALLLATAKGHTSCVKLLVEAKADVQQKSFKGNSSMDFSRHEDHKQVRKIIREATRPSGGYPRH